MMGDLRAAREAVGDDDVVFGGLLQCWEEGGFGEGVGYRGMLAFIAKGACHAAASWGQGGDLYAETF